MEHVMNRRTFLQGAAALPGLAAAVSCGRPRAGSDSVVVVGAGIVGASIGYHLAKRGARVTILEKDKPASAATGTSFAYLNASRKRPRPYYDLNLLGIDNWRRLQLEIGSELKIEWSGMPRAMPRTSCGTACGPTSSGATRLATSMKRA
jgi:glycine/D-amino acid oxidase-like deaminating enzyme